MPFGRRITNQTWRLLEELGKPFSNETLGLYADAARINLDRGHYVSTIARLGLIEYIAETHSLRLPKGFQELKQAAYEKGSVEEAKKSREALNEDGLPMDARLSIAYSALFLSAKYAKEAGMPVPEGIAALRKTLDERMANPDNYHNSVIKKPSSERHGKSAEE